MRNGQFALLFPQYRGFDNSPPQFFPPGSLPKFFPIGISIIPGLTRLMRQRIRRVYAEEESSHSEGKLFFSIFPKKISLLFSWLIVRFNGVMEPDLSFQCNEG
jgi:hypothetical protein